MLEVDSTVNAVSLALRCKSPNPMWLPLLEGRHLMAYTLSC